jgi:release factor glutamine methyltransferase
MNASVHERIAAAREALVRAGLAPTDAAVDASVLARHALGWDRATLVVRGRETPPPSFDSSFDEYVARRAAREPVALIMGMREFWGLDFEVTSDVLVPRPETEFIVEEALAAFDYGPETVIDIGTGTGCLAVALAREFSEARVIATDVSGAALEVARRNAARHGVDGRISFVRTNFLAGIHARADLIVSNPPYVPESAAPALAPEVVDHEPHIALFGGVDGLAPIRIILASAAHSLAAGGKLIVEFGLGQEPQVTELAEASGWQILRVREDLQGIARTIVLGRSS